MTIFTILPATMATVAIYVGVWHLLLYFRGLREKEHLYFAITCFGVGLYDICSAASYSTGNAAVWQRGQHVALSVLTPALLWFVLTYTRQGFRRLAMFLTCLFAVHLVAIFVLRGDWILTSQAHNKIVALPFGDPIVYRELRHGVLIDISVVVALVALGTMLFAAVRYYLTAASTERRRARLLLIGLAVFLAGMLSDIAVSEGLYSFIYLTEYTYVGMLLVMTFGMSSSVLEVGVARAEARRSHARLKRIFGSVRDVYVETSLDGTIKEISPSFYKLTGIDGDVRGRSIVDFYVFAEERERLVAILREEGTVEQFGIQVKVTDDDLRPCEISAALIPDDETGEPRIAGSLRDVSARKRAEAERARLEQQVQRTQKFESLGLLTGGIAHEFNNLLTGVLGSTELAMTELPASHPSRPRLDVVREASERATELCRQMLVYSGKGRFETGLVNLSDLIRDMLELIRISVSKRMVVETSLSTSLPTIEADSAQLRQILINLVVNASESVGGGDGRVTITTSDRDYDIDSLASEYVSDPLPAGRYVALEIADTGSGMDADARRKLFDPFFSTKFAGRGLGLAAVLGIVRGHNGSIQVDSRPGKGTTITVLLPATEKEPTPDEPTVSTTWTGEGAVLLVDDVATVREVGRHMLKKLGFTVTVAEDGRSAIKAFNSAPDDFVLVIVDMTMPDINGDVVASKLRKIRSDIPVLLASGYSERDIASRVSSEGFSGFVPKPFRLDLLRGKIRAALMQS